MTGFRRKNESAAGIDLTNNYKDSAQGVGNEETRRAPDWVGRKSKMGANPARVRRVETRPVTGKSKKMKARN